MKPVLCPYCGERAKLVTGQTLYPGRTDLAHIKAWECWPCQARVGCHDGTDRPKGRLANETTRRARIRAHRAFDPIWRNGNLSRKAAYKWLAGQLGIPTGRCHIGYFSVDECDAVVRICAQREE